MSSMASVVLGSSSAAMLAVQTQSYTAPPKALATLPRIGESNFPAKRLSLQLPAFGASACNSIFSLGILPSFSIKTAVTALNSGELSSADQEEKQEEKKYYFVVANAKFMLDEEEHFQELLFERRRNYGERNKEIDFWLVVEPKFLDKFPDISKRLKRPAVALVSTNRTWITFMKLRLDRVLSESYEADSLEEALASNPTSLSFEKPENWVAPYPKYEFGWWEPFLLPATKEKAAAEV